jgi:acyl-CoA synthetase (AMP-forming)/AMP-acid ligase II
MVPTMLQRVVSYLEERPKVDISSLTRIGYGSAPASAPLIESALELLGCDLWQRYGQSEVGGFVTMLSPEDHRRIALGDVARVNSCGRESMYAEIAVVDDDGKECAPGEVGEITLRSEAISPGYWDRPEETADRFRGDTLFTNDIAYRDEEGYLFLVDRKNDLIISGAFNIYPAELERVVARHPGVESVAVFGMPHPEWGESPHVSVVVRPQWDGNQDQLEQEIKDLCREELAGYKQPRGFTTHADFPLSGAGKVLKSELKKVVAEDTSS